MKNKKIIGIVLILAYFLGIFYYAFNVVGNDVFIVFAKVLGLILFSWLVGWLLVSE